MYILPIKKYIYFPVIFFTYWRVSIYLLVTMNCFSVVFMIHWYKSDFCVYFWISYQEDGCLDEMKGGISETYMVENKN